MNIFETHEGFSGRFDPDSTGGALQSLLTLAGKIRLKLGKQGYLLDSYLSLFLEGANAMLTYEAGATALSGAASYGACASTCWTGTVRRRTTPSMTPR